MARMSAHEKLVGVIRANLARSGDSVRATALRAGLPIRSVQNVLDGHDPRLSRAAEICDALGLEFYIGPPRASVDLEGEIAPTGLNVRSEIEAAAQSLTRAVLATGGDPIPDDLWPMLLERRSASGEPMPENEDMPKAGVRVLDGEASEDSAEPGEVIVPFARDIQAAAGAGSWVDDEGEQMRVAVPRSFIPGWASPGSLSCIRARGDSMEPALNDGDLILMDRSHIDPVDGEVFVIHSQDGLVVKRVRKIGGGWQMTSDNPAYKPRPLEEWDHNVGRVAWSGPLPATEAGGGEKR